METTGSGAVLSRLEGDLGAPRVDSAVRPFVLVSFAQSVDGALTAQRGRGTPISCPESLVMTHAVRGKVDAILVGASTVVCDDPSLTARLVSGRNPKPLVLDVDLTTPATCKLLTSPACVKPLILTRPSVSSEDAASRADAVSRLTSAGATVVGVPLWAGGGTKSHHLDLAAAMRLLRNTFGVRSVMVEGGAGVISSFFTQHDAGRRAAPLVDALLVTIAPMLLLGGLHVPGRDGAHALPCDLHAPEWRVVGRDIVLYGAIPA